MGFHVLTQRRPTPLKSSDSLALVDEVEHRLQVGSIAQVDPCGAAGAEPLGVPLVLGSALGVDEVVDRLREGDGEAAIARPLLDGNAELLSAGALPDV